VAAGEKTSSQEMKRAGVVFADRSIVERLIRVSLAQINMEKTDEKMDRSALGLAAG
jgi:hypothetical protein